MRAWVDGTMIVDEMVTEKPLARRAGADDETPFTLFADPFREEAESYFRLRELRLTAAAREPDAILADAERLGLTPISAP